MKRLRSAIASLLCLALALPLSGCGNTAKTEKQIFSMDTVMTLTAYGDNAEKGLEKAVSVINAMDSTLDPENENSAVYAINHAKGQSVVVTGQVVEMLDTARTVYERTGGVLDPAIYPLVKAWGFIDGKYTVPTQDAIDTLLTQIDFSTVKVAGFADSSDYLLTAPSGTQLTFGALAKGCASDYAIAALRQAGVSSACISLGGNVQTLGAKPDGSNWSIAVQDPNDTGSYVGVLSLGETAVVTSGGYQRYFEQDGVRYHHILDPRTGYPAESGLLSVTIICQSGLMADALSTTLYILGEDKAVDYWRTYGGFDMVLVTDDGRVVATSGLYDTFQSYGDKYSYEYVSE